MTVQIEHVSKKIKGNEVLRDVCLTLEDGLVYGIEGCNGSGKTMLMRMIAGLIHPTSGTVAVDGKILTGAGKYPATIGILIENPAFLDEYTGFQNLYFLASLREEIGKEEIRVAIRDVGLNPDDRRKYRKYSLGMKQRLGIAAALMERPQIILLDEPINALDAEGVKLVRQLIRRERDRGALVVLSCHDAAFLAGASDRVYHMAEGVLREAETDGKGGAE